MFRQLGDQIVHLTALERVTVRRRVKGMERSSGAANSVVRGWGMREVDLIVAWSCCRRLCLSI